MDRSPAEPGPAHTQPAEATSKIKETGYTHWKRREKCHDLPAMYFSTYKVWDNDWKTLKPTGTEVGADSCKSIEQVIVSLGDVRKRMTCILKR